MPMYAQLESDAEGGTDLELGRRLRRKRSLRRNFGSLGSRMMRSMTRQLQMHQYRRPVFILVAIVALLMLCIVLFSGQMHDSSLSGIRPRLEAFGASNSYSHLRNLVMVAGHSVYTNSGCGEVEGDDAWFLESYQKHEGQASTFVQHINIGVQVAAEDKNSLLLFSGGETRKEAGPRSEAQSYWGVAEYKDWFGMIHDLFYCMIDSNFFTRSGHSS
jgi:hypothetical protein